MSNEEVVYDDLGYLDEYIEQKEQEDRQFRSSNLVWLRPGKDQESRSTLLRPTWWRDNPFGQDRALIMFNLHTRLDEIIPGTSRRLFPHIKEGVSEAICVEPRANRRGRDARPQFCSVCRRVKALLAFNKMLEGKSKGGHDSRIKRFSRAFGMWVNGAKCGENLTFCAFQKLDPKKVSDHQRKLLVRLVEKEGKIVFAEPEDSGVVLVSPLMVVREKLFLMNGLIDLITEKAMTKDEYEEQIGHEIDEKEWKAKGPRKRPNLFDSKEGWAVRVRVSGKQLEMDFEFEAGTPKPLSRGENFLLRNSYPDIVSDLRVPGTESRFLDRGEWSAKNPGLGLENYVEYVRAVAAHIDEVLGVPNEGATDKVVKPSIKVFLAAGSTDDDLEDDLDDGEQPAPKKGRNTGSALDQSEEGDPF